MSDSDKIAIVDADFVIIGDTMAHHLGALEQLLMLVTNRLGAEAHGLAIRQELKAAAGRSVSAGTVYTTMDRLATKGLVSAWISDETPTSGGRRRKFYRLTPRGRSALEESMQVLIRLHSDAPAPAQADG